MAVDRLTDEAFAALKAKYPGAVLVPTRAGDYVAKVPAAEAFAEFLRDLGNGKKDEAKDRLVRAQRVYPEAVALDAMIERKPGIVDPCSGAILEAAGLDPHASYSFSEDDDQVTVQTAAGPVTLRCPSRIERKQYLEEREDKKKMGEAMTRYVQTCAVSPSAADFAALVVRLPGLVGTCINPLNELAGVEVTANVKK